MSTELRDEMVEATTKTVETAIESVATSDGDFIKAFGVVGGVIAGAVALGYGAYKLGKFVKNKKASGNGKIVRKHYTELQPQPTDFEDEYDNSEN